MRILDNEDVAKFNKAAKDYIKRALESKKIAQEKLIALGIYTKDGKLTDNYK